MNELYVTQFEPTSLQNSNRTYHWIIHSTSSIHSQTYQPTSLDLFDSLIPILRTQPLPKSPNQALFQPHSQLHLWPLTKSHNHPLTWSLIFAQWPYFCPFDHHGRENFIYEQSDITTPWAALKVVQQNQHLLLRSAKALANLNIIEI